jgi:hypothetical protein
MILLHARPQHAIQDGAHRTVARTHRWIVAMRWEAPQPRYGVLAPHGPTRDSANLNLSGVESDFRPSVCRSTSPAQPLLPYEFQGYLLEHFLGQRAGGRCETIQISTTMVCFHCPGHFVVATCRPHNARRGGFESFAAIVTKLCVCRVDVHTTEGRLS